MSHCYSSALRVYTATVAIASFLLVSGSCVEAAPGDERAVAGDSDPLEVEAREYCNRITAAASTESATLEYPWLFVDAGVIPVHSLELSTPADQTRTNYIRLRSGLGFSPTRFYRGVLTTAHARAECERFRAARKWHRSNVGSEDASIRRAAWLAKLSSVEASLPKAQELLERAKSDAKVGTSTVVELDAIALSVQQLRELAAEARARLAELTDVPTLPQGATPALAEERMRAEEQLARVESKLRRSAAFDVTVTGGYDRFFGSDQRLPLFAMVGVTFSPSWFVTGTYEDRATSARAREIAASTEQAFQAARQRARRLQGSLDAHQSWLQDLVGFRTDLERRMAEVSTVAAEKSQAYATRLWFEIARLRAEEAYLETHVSELRHMFAPHTQPSFRAAVDNVPSAAAPSSESPRNTHAGARDGMNAAPEFASLNSVGYESLCVTRGHVARSSGHTVRVDEPTFRAFVPGALTDLAALRFSYHGATARTAKLASGAQRRQLGLKLRAENGCNLVYAMLRIAPEAALVVSVKRNPGKSTHAECGALGYRNVKPLRSATIPELVAGSTHVLGAKLHEGALQIWLDDVLVWEGELGPNAADLRGPVGLRSDNVRWEFELSANRTAESGVDCKTPIGTED